MLLGNGKNFNNNGNNNNNTNNVPCKKIINSEL